MARVVEAYRLRALIFAWRHRAGKACGNFCEYKGGRWCGRCDETADAHEARRCADELATLLAEQGPQEAA
jgi:hypothetical protein